MSMPEHQKRELVRRLAALADLVEKDACTGFSLIAVYPNGTVDSIGHIAPSVNQMEQLLIAMDKALFRIKLITYTSGAKPQGGTADGMGTGDPEGAN